jgi:TolB-like protein
MSDTGNKAVFLSYASQDADAARRICEALRASGVEVWFDQNELVGGDAWDAKIRKQIKECALFVPVISATTQARHEGYFRLEWKLAAERTHMMSGAKAFLLPVVIDDTRDADAHVPLEFRAVQWIRLTGENNPPALAKRVRTLVGDTLSAATSSMATSAPGVVPMSTAGLIPKRPKGLGVLLAGFVMVAAIGVTLFVMRKSVPSTRAAATASDKPSTSAIVTVDPADRSVAVLPLENLSADPADRLFADGLHAETIATLGQIPGWKVIMRQSTLEFKDRGTPLAEIGRELGVAHLVIGSVRRGSGRVVVLLELRRASDAGLVWSKRFDRPFQDALAIQSEIATDVAQAFQMREARGSAGSAALLTKNPRAYDLHLQAMGLFLNRDRANTRDGRQRLHEAVALWHEAAELDPGFMWPAWGLSSSYAEFYRADRTTEKRETDKRAAKEWAERASRLVSGGAGDVALADYYYRVEIDLPRALVLAQNAVRALPNDATSINVLAHVLSGLGRMREGLAARHRAVELDPLNALFWENLLSTAQGAREWTVAREALRRYRALPPDRLNAARLHDCSYRIEGVVPADLSGMDAGTQAFWLWRARNFEECLGVLNGALTGRQYSSGDVWMMMQRALVLRRLGRTAESRESAQQALEAGKKLPDLVEVEMLDAVRGSATLLALTGRGDEAVGNLRRYLEARKHEGSVVLGYCEVALAELWTLLGRNEEAVTLIAQLLRKPWGLSVSDLKANPTWDSLRGSAAFNGLLADPENDKPFP